jgi:hypothetical protein
LKALKVFGWNSNWNSWWKVEIGLPMHYTYLSCTICYKSYFFGFTAGFPGGITGEKVEIGLPMQGRLFDMLNFGITLFD